MVQLGKSFILIIEPDGFNVYKEIFHHTHFGFVIGSHSEWFRNSMFGMLQQYLTMWQQHYSPAILGEIQQTIGRFTQTNKIKDNEVIFRFICGLGALAYYLGETYNNRLNLKTFTIIDMDNSKPLYYCYVGTNDYSSMEINAKIMSKVYPSHTNSGTREGCCFELQQIPI